MSKTRVGRTAGELILVVVGVLIALSAEDWLASRNDEDLAATYREDVLADLRTDSAQVELWMSVAEARVDAISSMLDQLNGVARIQAGTETLMTLFAASVVPAPDFSRATYDDLINTGNVRLLDFASRRELLRYLADLDRLRSNMNIWGEVRPDFTGRIPGAFYRYVDCIGQQASSSACFTAGASATLSDMHPADREAMEAWPETPRLRQDLQEELGETLTFLWLMRSVASTLESVITVVGS